MYKYEYLKDFVKEIFLKIGCSLEDAELVSDVLLEAELRGINSHGVIRIKDYVRLWEVGRINSKPNIKVKYQTPGTAVIDADKSIGMVSAHKAMNLAIEKAKTCGTGWVSVRNSNHFGIAGYYSMMALEHDMIGISMTNANPSVAPTFSIERLLGTNPISVSIPAGKQPPFVADFATTPIPRGKLVVMHKKGEKAPLGFVQDKTGKPSDNPNIIADGGAIVPLGGDRVHGSHKGYCLEAVVDIFSSLLSGANYGPWVPPIASYLPLKEKTVGEGTGHFFGAMRINAFQPAIEFKEKMDDWINTFRNAKTAEGHEKVLIPGDPERELKEQKLKNGIELLPAVIQDLKTLSNKFGLNF
ncbi:MAG: Ldh family oxidoreductase [Bacteroidales bacterium]|nr:Ldh family oxidoreductase [Bacteroidales bacterium]